MRRRGLTWVAGCGSPRVGRLYDMGVELGELQRGHEIQPHAFALGRVGTSQVHHHHPFLEGVPTDIVAVHDHLPPGLSAADNETGWRMSLGKLAELVEGLSR